MSTISTNHLRLVSECRVFGIFVCLHTARNNYFFQVNFWAILICLLFRKWNEFLHLTNRVRSHIPIPIIDVLLCFQYSPAVIAAFDPFFQIKNGLLSDLTVHESRTRSKIKENEFATQEEETKCFGFGATNYALF